MENIARNVLDALTVLKLAKANYADACKQFGKDFRQLRKEQGESLRDCAKRLGFSAPYLADVELGRRLPNEKILYSVK
jgi:hypothetical protein